MSVLKIKNEQGEFISIPSVSGRGITSITKISTVGLIDTYRILYTDGTTQDYEVKNGSLGYETDPVFTQSPAYNIENQDIQNWNNKPDTSDIPTKVSDLDNDSDFQTETEVVEAIGEHNQSITSHLDIRQLIALINALIPTQATAQNQLGDKDFINSSLNSITAFYITKNASGDQFNSKAELNNALIFYSGGEVRVPTRNDYCIVLEDETKDNATTRYIFQNNQWEYQYTVNETALTAAQLAAINSGITSALTGQISTNKGNIATILADYITSTDYAKNDVVGLVKGNDYYGTSTDGLGNFYAKMYAYENYINKTSNMVISKGTLENVINGKGLLSDTYVDLSSYNIDDNITDTNIINKLKNRNVVVKYNMSYYRLAIINEDNAYIYTTMNNATSGDYIVLYDNGSSFLVINIATATWETSDNKVISISSTSNDTQYPSAKAVYDYIQSLDGSEVAY